MKEVNGIRVSETGATDGVCKIDGCSGLGHKHTNGKLYMQLGYCDKHYRAYSKYGDPLHRTTNVNIKKYSWFDDDTYRTYNLMKRRIFNPRDDSYYLYGGRCIGICDRRLGVDGYKNFFYDMGKRPSKKNSIDRKDSNKDYGPDNCKWSTAHQQAANTRRNNKNVGVNLRKDKKSKPREARIRVGGTSYRLGYFQTEQEAVDARKKGEMIYLGYNI